MVKVGLFAYPGCIASGLFGAAEVLESVNRLTDNAIFDIYWAGISREAVSISATNAKKHSVWNSVQIVPEKIVNEGDLDVVIIPGTWDKSDEKLHALLIKSSNLINHLSKIPESTQILAYCSSVALLAKSGKLKDQKASATWWSNLFYSTTFPNVDWNFKRALTWSDTVATASGTFGYLPLTMRLVEEHAGLKTMSDIIKLMVLPRPELAQAPFRHVDIIALQHPLLKKVHQWTINSPAKDLTQANIAKHFKTSERTLCRRLKEATGMPTGQFLKLVKLNQACDELTMTNDSIPEISDRLGFSDESVFRRLFKQECGVSAKEYRERFKRSFST